LDTLNEKPTYSYNSNFNFFVFLRGWKIFKNLKFSYTTLNSYT
jgi:hypothetical protein